MSGKIVLIDGHSILNRAFYGVPELSNSSGLYTNAIYGFLNILFSLLEEEKPQYLVVAFDQKGPTFRHKLYAEYKGTRKPMPTELVQQVPIIQDVLKAMGIAILGVEGLEADDILGTLAKNSEKERKEVVIVSGDRDLLQIASDKIKIRIPKTKKGKTEIEDYYAKEVKELYQVTPEQFIELKALMGDSSDNIPGVPKVGEKTAIALMLEYGSLKEIFAHVDQISKNSIRESLKNNEELAWLSKELATIKIDCELEFDIEKAKVGQLYTKEAYEWFKKLEFKNMLQRFQVEENSCEELHWAEHFQLIKTQVEFEELCFNNPAKEVGIYVIQEDDELLALGMAFSQEEIYYIPITKELKEDKIKEKIYLLSKEKTINVFDIKKYYSFMQKEDISQYFDILIAAYLIYPLKSDYAIEDIASKYFDLMIPSEKEVFGKMSFLQVYLLEPDKCMQYVCYNAIVSLLAAKKLRELLVTEKMDTLMNEIEMPLSYVLYEMEQEGIMVQKEELQEYGRLLEVKMKELEEKIYQQCEGEFNLNSPKQLGGILFEKLNIPGGKKTKTGYSTAAEVLEKLAPEYAVVKDILEYRGVAKLNSTYANGLGSCIKEDGRIHSTFNQTVTATGRISSTEPNLQNIPMRMELGRRIRKVFIPKENYVFVDADYSQIELRLLAHLSGDKQLIEAYEMAEDIHKITASKVFQTPLHEVTQLQRSNAKAVNFGIVYGISSFGLSQDLNISKKEAAEYIEQYFATYPQIKYFLDELVDKAKNSGYVTTLYGRKRPIPEIKSNNFMQRSFGERIAMNSPIQGTAADIMKIAMIETFYALKKEALQSKLILQVHDELLIETHKDEIEKVKEILNVCMKNVVKLAVMLEIDVHVGENWYEAK